MDESGTNNRTDAPCREYLAWQNLLDEQLGVDESELLLHHLETCPACVEQVATLKRAKSLCEDQLGAEDDNEEESSRLSLDRAKRQIDLQRAMLKQPRPVRRWWRYYAIAALVILSITSVLLLPSFWNKAGASAEAILEEAILREREKAYQPGKVLHWVTESDCTGLTKYADGHYRTATWQCNCDGGLALITRRYDQENRLVEAFWRQPNGSEVRLVYGSGGLVEVIPGDDELRRALPTIDPALRQPLENYVTRRTDSSRQHLRTQGFADWFRRALSPSDSRSSAKVIETPDNGRIYQLHIEQDYQPPRASFVRVVSEQDIAGSTYQRLRVKNTRYRADGSFSVDNTIYTEMNEVSRADFETNDLKELLNTSKKVVHLSPDEVARREVQETRARLAQEKP